MSKKTGTKGKKAGVKKDRTSAVRKTKTHKLKRVLQSSGLNAAKAYALAHGLHFKGA